jgi:hypothetical protein
MFRRQTGSSKIYSLKLYLAKIFGTNRVLCH